MKCPKCQIEMETKNVKGVSLDECSRCKGIWFDSGELDKIKEDVDPDVRWIHFDLWKKMGKFQVTFQPLPCPKEHRTNLRSLYFEAVDVKIQFCPTCAGIWLQAGDFNLIVQALIKEAENMEVSDYVRASLKEASEIVVHPKNLISEWRDLKAVLRLLKYRFFTENPEIKDLILGIQKSLPL